MNVFRQLKLPKLFLLTSAKPKNKRGDDVLVYENFEFYTMWRIASKREPRIVEEAEEEVDHMSKALQAWTGIVDDSAGGGNDLDFED